MQVESALRFGAYKLDPTNRQLWRRKRVITLTDKAFQVLYYLAQHPGQLVTKNELFQAVWSETVVTDSALTVCIKEIRKALRDKATTPRHIETVYRQGYRFVGKVVRSQHTVDSSMEEARDWRLETSFPSAQASSHQSQVSCIVGRETELAQLHGYLDKALNGARQIVFVSGEPGIGKTTLVEAFRQRLETGDWRLVPSAQASSLNPHVPRRWLVGRGLCIEQYGAGEAYMPVLEAMGRLCRESGGERLIMLLGQYAPTWLAQMPALLSAEEAETFYRKTHGATRERMLREMSEAIEAISTERPLILVLEDLHWSDTATLELLAVLARRRETARFFILGTYRPVEALGCGHPLAGILQELDAHSLCHHLPLGCLPIPAIAEYLARRFPGETAERPRFQRLATLLQQRTEGNPLFLVGVVDDLLAQGILAQRNGKWEIRDEQETLTKGVPITIRQVISRQQDLLQPGEQRVLEAASVAGREFSAAAVAAAVMCDVSEVEDCCEALVNQRRFLCRLGICEWPDGTLAARYGFLHALYQQLWHERVSVSRLQRWHQRIGERKEAAYGEAAGDIATELAVHFEQGRDYRRVVWYLGQARERAMRRGAHVQAVNHLLKGLGLLKMLPDTPERTRQELILRGVWSQQGKLPCSVRLLSKRFPVSAKA